MRVVERFLLLVSLTFATARIADAQECTSDGRLCDTHERCAVWQEEGHCLKNGEYMREHCPVSCLNFEKPKVTSECVDHHLRCPVWAEAGECLENQHNMHKFCRKSCKLCGGVSEDVGDETTSDPLCVDSHENCAFWASKGECQVNPAYMEKNCPKSCGTCKPSMRSLLSKANKNKSSSELDFLGATDEFGERQNAIGDKKVQTLDVIMKSITYMRGDAASLPQSVLAKCLNRHELCSFWAGIGECEKNRSYMVTNCAPACRSCDMIDIDARCPPLENPKAALEPGDLNNMFERIVNEAPGNRTLTDQELRDLKESDTTIYSVTVHSQPAPSETQALSTKLDKASPPWVITFDDFLTPAECQALVELGYKYGYERSRDVGGQKFDGSYDAMESTGRTSENAWCSALRGCRAEDLVQRIHNRIGRTLGIPAENSEDLQILKYEKGQFYRSHHDYIPHQKDRHGGPRILTFFLYLSDVEAGGGTHFSGLDITVMPKVGRALLWPSVLNSSPFDVDRRTSHEALPVEEGVKFAANAWIHSYDYLVAQAQGCN